MHVLLHSMPPTLEQATTDPHLVGDSWTLTGQSESVFCMITAPFSWVLVHRFSLCPPRVYFQSYVSSGGSLLGLRVMSSKRAYAIPKSAAPRAPVPAAVHCWPVPPQETLKHSSVSVSMGSLDPDAPKVCLNLLIISGGNGVWFWMWINPFYHLSVASPFPLDMGYLLMATPVPTILLGFLWPWTWAILSWPLATNSTCYLC